MATSIIEIDTEDHLADETGVIGGKARVRIETAFCYDGDIGGIDGWQVTECTLLDLTIGGLTLTADQLATAFGAKVVTAFEEMVADEYVEERLAA